ncbi:hypothetical protein [Aneurinibacillus migulanus]|uniref:Uncharacterized protein n=1 Tax=Aneurinibacillus migulanus TaxID=47500 RepID=A0A0D1XU07_ANEMI|nr:hypothetical protein [Aneurinibacillus migulanus]KIV57691.1 hypothetical protein TS65_09205 [Aneurinibacillus migulanus]KON95871.1 hypothetical protein AF333_10615 [Aneurinibacillus migulanus]MED0891959.1 hypothetical protein [Aneurinibacillus migulanus]MED1617301.1 hypothetical protein [Aneurinibacillus migulanus]SDK26610.1 hypothetical protein SAMN04487909_14629 [Aneurinibacillus migulanus]
MAVPKGWSWVRDMDPNATFNPQSRQLTVNGKTYNDGSYMIENGRAYLNANAHQQAIQPKQGQIGVRFLFGGRDDSVGWDQKTGRITTPSGQLNRGDYTINKNDRAMIGYDQAAYLMLNRPVRELNQQNFDQTFNMFRGAYESMLGKAGSAQSAMEDYAAKAKGAQEAAVNAAYQQAQSNLKRQETGSWNRMMESARNRGIEDSNLMSYEQAKVTGAYAPEYQQLESNRAAGLAQAAAHAAQIGAEAQMRGDATRAQAASQVFSAAINQLNRMQDIDLRKNEQLSNLMMGLYDRSREDNKWDRQFDSQQTQQSWENNFRAGQQKADNLYRDKTFNENQRQFNLGRQDDLYKFDKNFGENQRQFNLGRQDRRYEFDAGRQDRRYEFDNNLSLNRDQFAWQKQYQQGQLTNDTNRTNAEIKKMNEMASGVKKSKNDTRAEALQLFSDMKNQGPIAVPEVLQQISSNAQAYSSQGYDVQTVRDTLIEVATNGKYKNEAAWNKAMQGLSQKAKEQTLPRKEGESYKDYILRQRDAVANGGGGALSGLMK